MVKSTAARYGVPHDLAYCITYQESRFNPNARSEKDARGLMQLMPSTARSLGVKNAFDPQDNVSGGVRYLAQLGAQFPNDPRKVMAAYNAGPGAVQQYKGVPPYAQTRAYVKEVSQCRANYSKLQ